MAFNPHHPLPTRAAAPLPRPLAWAGWLLALVLTSNDLTSNLNFIAYSSLVYWLHDINLGKL